MKKIVCFGDSNTYGYIPAKGGRFDSGTRWSSLLQKMMPDIEITEAGLNGRTTVFDDPVDPERNGSRALEKVLRENEGADVYLIMLGTNDCKTMFGADAGMIARGLDVLVSQIRLFDRNIHTVIICPACITSYAVWEGSKFGYDSVKTSEGLREQYRITALQNGCGFIPACDYITPDSSDGIHLNGEGHRLLAELVFKYLNEFDENEKI